MWHLANLGLAETLAATRISTAQAAARLAGDAFAKRDASLLIETKTSPKDIVTQYDLAAQRTIEDLVTRNHPDDAFLGEESVAPGADASATALDGLKRSEWLWVVDPLDGTTNFASSLPLSTVSIGLAHFGELVGGVIYDPYRQEMFVAEAGGAATMNGEQIAVSDATTLGQSILAAGCPPNPRSLAPSLRGCNYLAPRVNTIRMLGSAALMMAWVAAGRLTAYFENDLNSWDTAAGAVIIRAAGGQITGLDGEEFTLATRTLLCSNGGTHASFLESLRDADAACGLDPE